MANLTKVEREALRAELRELLAKTDHKVYGIVRHVSASGMSRVIDFLTIIDNRPYWLSWNISQLLDIKQDKKYQGLRIGGCGMDMIFHTVYSLSIELYCPDKYDHDSAYKLKSEQL